MSSRTKIISFKNKKKSNSYKDILSNPEKVKEILKKKKTKKNYQYLNSNLMFDKDNNLLNKPKTNDKIIKETKNLNKSQILIDNNAKNNNSSKHTDLKKNMVISRINVSQSKKTDFSNIRNLKRKNKKINKKNKSTKIDAYFKPNKISPSTKNIKNKVLLMLSKVLKYKSDKILIQFINKLNKSATKILVTYLNLVKDCRKLDYKFLKMLLYISLCNNVIIYKIN